MEGYNRMLKEIEPSKIICYSEPFKEMQGDIIYIDYELSSWKHLSDDKSFLIKKPPLNRNNVVIKYYGYVCKGGGSAKGGDRIPKKPNDERFLDDYKFETLGEFKIYLDSGWNVGFEYNSIEYGIEGHNNSFYIWNANAILANGLTLEEVLDYKLDGVKIRDLILDAEITERLA